MGKIQVELAFLRVLLQVNNLTIENHFMFLSMLGAPKGLNKVLQ